MPPDKKGSKGMNWKGHSLPGGARLRSDCPYHISIYDNMDRRTQAVGNVDANLQAVSGSRQPAYKECRRAPILLCRQSLDPLYIPGCSLIHTRKIGRIVLKDLDLENGVLRLPLRLAVSSKNIYGEGAKKKRVYCLVQTEN
jgi:hypothetical protein